MPIDPKGELRTVLSPNGPKVREGILRIIWSADQAAHRPILTQFDILKTLFVADRSHLNRYGRPITFDRYVAMKDGPVPSLAYDILKLNSAACEKAGIIEPLWAVEPTGGAKNNYFRAIRDASDEILSESDLEELTAALGLVRKLGYRGTWDRTHADPAYIEAWAKRGNSKQFTMDFALLFDKPNRQAAEELKFAANHR